MHKHFHIKHTDNQQFSKNQLQLHPDRDTGNKINYDRKKKPNKPLAEKKPTCKQVKQVQRLKYLRSVKRRDNVWH